MEMTALEVLKAARKLITPRKRWTQGWFAYSANNNPVKATSRVAVCWCAGGAIKKFNKNELGEPFSRLDKLPGVRHLGVFQFNDAKTHKEVLSAFDEAIRREENK